MPITNRNICRIGFYLVVFIFISGCAGISSYNRTYKESAKTGSLPVALVLRFSDIPIPMGFTILDAESFTFQNDVTRVGLLKYLGSKHPDMIQAFYKEQMPLYNWNPINFVEYERRILNYERGAESCIVTIEAVGRKTFITVAISPKSKPMKVDTEKK